MLSGLQLTGKLNGHLEQIDRQATEMMEKLTNEMAKAQGVNETLKATDQMKWVRKMNNIRNRAVEMVNNEVIYGQL